jgi:hypothetical protein
VDRNQHVFVRDENFVQFNQYGIKLDFPDGVDDRMYYEWLDEMISAIGQLVPGAEIVEKLAARSDPRRNSGVYYDTADYRLLRNHMVLRTTSNPKTHAFCAFKYGEDEHGVRRDNRHIFEGADKLAIQMNPTGEQAVATVRRLLSRQDIMHPGIVLGRATGIRPDELTPALSLIQYRRTFYVWLDKSDALRCSLDRAEVTDLRNTSTNVNRGHFNEVEVPIYPRISPLLLADERVQRLIDSISRSLVDQFGATEVHDSKYRRGARVIGLLD